MQTDRDLFLQSKVQFALSHKRVVLFTAIVSIVLTVLLLGVASRFGFRISKKLPSLLSADKGLTVIQSFPLHMQTDVRTNSRPTFAFSKPLTVLESNLKNYFSITPAVEGKWKYGPNRQIVEFIADQTDHSFEYNSVYTVRVLASIGSILSGYMKQDVVVSYRTIYDPNLLYRVENKVIHAAVAKNESDITVPLRYQVSGDAQSAKPTKYQINVFRTSLEEVLPYALGDMSKNDRFSYRRNIFQHTIKNRTPLQTYTVKINSYKTEYNYVNDMKLQPFQEQGWYLVTYGDGDYRDEFIVSYLDFVALTITDLHGTQIKAVDSQTGKPISDTKIETYDVTDSKVSLKELKENGLIPVGGIGGFGTTAEKIPYVYVIRKGDQFTYINPPGKTNSQYRVFAITDKDIYRPGETIKYKATVRKIQKGELAIPTEQFYVHISDPERYEQDKPEYTKVAINQYGSLIAEFSTKDIEKNALIRLAVKDPATDIYTTIDSFSVPVIPYEMPSFEVTVSVPQLEYVSKDEIKATLVSKSLFGTHMGSVPFTYRIVATPYTEVIDNSETATIDYGYQSDGTTFQQGEGAFDTRGVAEIAINSDLRSYLLSQMVYIEVTPQIALAPSIAKSKVLIHRGQFGIFIESTPGSEVNGVDVNMRIMSHDSPRIERNDIEYEVILKSEQGWTDTQRGKTRDGGKGSVHFTPPSNGNYTVTIQAKDGVDNIVTTTQSVWIPKIQSYNTHSQIGDVRKHSLSLELSDAKASPGSVVPVKVKSNMPTPYLFVITSSASEILAIREGVHATGALKLQMPDKPTSSILVQVFTVYEGEVYEESERIHFLPQNKDELQVEAIPSKSTYMPGETATIHISTKKNGKPVSAEVTLVGIDAALTQVRSMSKDMHKSMYNSEFDYSSAQTAHSLTPVWNSLDFLGGGGGGGGGGQERGDFRDIAFWVPQAMTNAEGVYDMQVTLPDDLTTYSINAFAASGATDFGQANSSFRIMRDTAIIPLLAQDYRSPESLITAQVLQNVADNEDFELELSVQEADYHSRQMVSTKKGIPTPVTFSVAIPDQIKLVTFAFTLRDTTGTVRDAYEASRPVTQPRDPFHGWGSYEQDTSLTLEPESGVSSIDLEVDVYTHPIVNLATHYSSDAAISDEHLKSAMLINALYEGLPVEFVNYPRMLNQLIEVRDQAQLTNSLFVKNGSFGDRYDWSKEDKIRQGEQLIESAYLYAQLFELTKKHSLGIGSNTVFGELARAMRDKVNSMDIHDSIPLQTYESLIDKQVYVTANTSNKSQQAIHDALSVLFSDAPLSTLDWTRAVSADDRVIYQGISNYNFKNLPLYAIVAKSPQKEMTKLLKGLMVQGGEGDRFTYDLIINSALEQGLHYIPDAKITLKKDGSPYELMHHLHLPIQSSSLIDLSIPDGYGFVDVSVEQYGADPQHLLAGARRPKVLQTLEKKIIAPNSSASERMRLVTVRTPFLSVFPDTYQGYFGATIADRVAPNALYLNGDLKSSPQVQSMLSSQIGGQSTYPEYSNENGVGSRNWHAPSSPTFAYAVFNLSSEREVDLTATSVIFGKLGVIFTTAK